MTCILKRIIFHLSWGQFSEECFIFEILPEEEEPPIILGDQLTAKEMLLILAMEAGKNGDNKLKTDNTTFCTSHFHKQI